MTLGMGGWGALQLPLAVRMASWHSTWCSPRVGARGIAMRRALPADESSLLVGTGHRERRASQVALNTAKFAGLTIFRLSSRVELYGAQAVR